MDEVIVDNDLSPTFCEQEEAPSVLDNDERNTVIVPGDDAIAAAAAAAQAQAILSSILSANIGTGWFQFIDRDINTPPVSPTTGDTYLIGSSPTGAWTGKAGQIASWQSGWNFIVPREGMGGGVQDENLAIVYFDGSWLTLTVGGLAGVTLDTDPALAANSDTRVPSQKAVKSYVDAAVVGLLDFKGTINCSANPNYPAALKGDAYIVSVAGRIGGASGQQVEAGDFLFAEIDTAAGTEAAVGANWGILQVNQLARTRVITAAIVGTALGASEMLLAVTPPSGETWTFAGNLAGASGLKLAGGVNPASSYVIDVRKNGASVGSITISTSGVVTFSTTSGASITIVGGTDTFELVGPATVGTAVGYALAIPASY